MEWLVLPGSLGLCDIWNKLMAYRTVHAHSSHSQLVLQGDLCRHSPDACTEARKSAPHSQQPSGHGLLPLVDSPSHAPISTSSSTALQPCIVCFSTWGRANQRTRAGTEGESGFSSP